MTTVRYSTSLRIFTKTVDPDEICRTLGKTAKVKNKIGEARTTLKGQPLEGVYERSYCVFELPPREGEELHTLLARSVDDLKKGPKCKPKEELVTVEENSSTPFAFYHKTGEHRNNVKLWHEYEYYWRAQRVTAPLPPSK